MRQQRRCMCILTCYCQTWFFWEQPSLLKSVCVCVLFINHHFNRYRPVHTPIITPLQCFMSGFFEMLGLFFCPITIVSNDKMKLADFGWVLWRWAWLLCWWELDVRKTCFCGGAAMCVVGKWVIVNVSFMAVYCVTTNIHYPQMDGLHLKKVFWGKVCGDYSQEYGNE